MLAQLERLSSSTLIAPLASSATSAVSSPRFSVCGRRPVANSSMSAGIGSWPVMCTSSEPSGCLSTFSKATWNLNSIPLVIEIWSSRRSEEHTSELQSLMRISYAVFCLKKKKQTIIDMDKNLTKHDQQKH